MFLGLCMALMLAPTAVAFAAPQDSWDNHAADSFAGGDGSQDNPYQIETAAQLAYLAKISNEDDGHATAAKHYQLKDNIDLSAFRWIPIGRTGWNLSAYPGAFLGYFDGNGKTITGLYVDETATNCFAGLFGKIIGPRENAAPVICNLSIEGAYIAAANALNTETRVGILAGEFGSFSNSMANTSIVNVSVSGTISRGDGDVTTGGLIGYAMHLSLSGCSAEISISSDKANADVNGNAGGLLGLVVSVSVENCTASGSISGSWVLGGFVSEALSSQFSKCSAKVDVTGNDWNLGGFIGINDSASSIRNCAAYGDVTSTFAGDQPKTGGFAGTNGGSISYCDFAGTVIASSPSSPVGGFVGYDDLGSTAACTYDADKNADVDAIGQNGTASNNAIAPKNTAQTLSAICSNLYSGHDYSADWTIDAAATCSQEGSKSHHCSRCGDKKDITAIPFSDHSPEKTEAQAATETQAGNIAYWHCSVCGKYFSDQALTQEISMADTVIPALGHAHHYRDEWKADGASHWRECACGEKAEISAHIYGDWTVTKAATAAQAGSRERRCEICGYQITEPIGALKTDLPKTGDASHTARWAQLLAFAVGGVILTLLAKRKSAN